MSGKLEDYKKQLTELSKRRGELASMVANLEEKNKGLTPRVKDLETREKSLSDRITEMEPRAQKAETTLIALNKETQKLKDTTFKELAEFNERVQVVAQCHNIKPTELKSRLLHELETLDKGLGLEALLQNRQQELDKKEEAITSAKNELETVKAVVGPLKQEKTTLEASIKETREHVSREIEKITPVARDTISQLVAELRHGHDEALAEVRRLKDEAVEVGKEVGRYEGILQANQWLSELLALVRGDESIEAKRVRVIILLVLHGTVAWLKHNGQNNLGFSTLSLYTGNLIKELEQWKA